MKSVAKNLTAFKIDNLLFESKFKIQEDINDTPRKVPDFHFCRSQPKARKLPHVAGLSKSALKLLDLDYDSALQDENTPLYLSGSKLLLNSKPLCSNYCGHQFGVWAGQLGDGRAHTLGPYINSNKQIWELQLKGSGITPFSRLGDGNSVVSSALREFLCSEAMVGLGVPTTRAASLVIAQQMVKRDPFYDGNIKMQNAAIVLRLSPSFLRFGNFQLCNPTAPCHKSTPLANRQFLLPLADFLLHNHYPQLLDQQLGDPYESLFSQLLTRSALLVAKWQSLGFVHGVLNTDNMSMLGLTIDYGPFGWIDYFSKDFVSNATDTHERYSYRQQPKVVKWNLNRLAEAMDQLVPVGILKKKVQQRFDEVYGKEYYRLMAEKLGVREQGEKVKDLVDGLMDVMHQFACNFTNVFRLLSGSLQDRKEAIQKLIAEACPIKTYHKNLRVFPQLLKIPPETLKKVIEQDEGFNASIITEQTLRISKEKQLSTISKEQYEKLQATVWGNWLDKYSAFKKDSSLQNQVNPYYVLRNDVASKLLKHLSSLNPASRPQFLSRVLSVFQNPYTPDPWFQQFWGSTCDPIKLTCSS